MRSFTPAALAAALGLTHAETPSAPTATLFDVATPLRNVLDVAALTSSAAAPENSKSVAGGMPVGYEVVLTHSLPYASITMPMKFVVDCEKKREKIEYYQGLETDFMDTSGKYKYVYKNNERVCLHNEAPHTGSVGDEKWGVESTRDLSGAGIVEGQKNSPLVHPFPADLKAYKKQGPAIFDGIKCTKFTMDEPHGSTGTMDDHLAFYYDELLHQPVAWVMHSRNKVFGSHTDEYRIRYLAFSESTNPEIGKMPAACDKARELGPSNGGVPVLNWPAETLFGVMGGRGQETGQLSAAFSTFATKHGLQYASAAEWKQREEIFHQNLQKIARLNEEHGEQARFSANKFAAMTVQEVMRSRGGYRKSKAEKKRASETELSSFLPPLPSDVPENYDWRVAAPGSISPVKDQGICGSCWAFSLISAVESANYLKSKPSPLIPLPEQMIIDCTWTDELAACDGGESSAGAEQVIAKFGGEIPTADTYGKYLTVDGYCHKQGLQTGALVSSWVSLPARDESAVLRALLQQPLSVAFNVGDAVLYYDTGIVNAAECEKHDSSDLNHAINLVGYGTCPKTGLKYWTLRNSWSTYWGEKGYFRVVRGERDCGVTTDAGYPVVQGVGNARDGRGVAKKTLPDPIVATAVSGGEAEGKEYYYV